LGKEPNLGDTPRIRNPRSGKKETNPRKAAILEHLPLANRKIKLTEINPEREAEDTSA